ncbi:hypothetical protein PRIPAC_82546, partial [Pristionchus pacificus]|uniref:G protein-coupled receptor n=1 Tax=Pristionchus pacificus TaxID=54126 RepID=A0A2A6CMD0_PRIPA
FLLCFYLAFYTMTFVLIDYSFLYRMWAVESPVKVRYFTQPWFITLLSLITALEFAIWYCNSLLIFNGTPEGREEMYEIVMEKYGVDTRSHAMIMGDYVRNGTLHVRSFVGYGIYVSVLSICFGFIIVASIRIIAFLGNHDAMMSTMSGKTKQLQTRLFKILCWQTRIPFIFLYIPCGASLTLPLLRFNASPLADVTSVVLSFFLPLDALVVLFMMRDYRVAVARMLQCCSSIMSASNFVTEFNIWLKLFAPAILILGNLLGCFIVIVLLKVLSMTRLHVNCKFLLNSWSICFITMFSLHIAMFVLNFSMDELPKNKADPPIRISLHTIISCMQLITTFYELCIATERLISTIRPMKYYARSLDRKYLYPGTLAITGCLLMCQYHMTESGNHTLFTGIVLTLDLFTISVNEFAVKYGTRRFEQMQGKTTLNGRYQVKESSQLAKAMQPVGIPVTDEPSEPFVMRERAGEGDVYFEKLARVWNEGLKGVLFITVDLLYSSVQIVFQERIITHNTIFCLITIGGGNNQFLLCFYLAFYTMTFVLIDYGFLYRMAVESYGVSKEVLFAVF